MKKEGGFFKRHKGLIIFIIIVIILAGIGFWIASKVKEAQQMLTDMATAGEVVEIEKRSLVDSLAATGSVSSTNENDVVANITGLKFTEINFRDGDVVKKGDILAKLDTDNLETSLNNAKANLDASSSRTNSDLAVSKRMLGETQDNRNVQIVRDYEDAQLRYDDYMKALDDLDQAQAEYDAAVYEYNWRASEYNNYKGDHSDLDEFEFLNFTERGSFYRSNMKTAESEMNSKEAALKNAQTAADRALETYNNLIRSYEDHLKNNDSNIMTRNDTLINSRINSTVAGLTEAAQIQQYEKQLAECVFVAPIDGILTNLNFEVGDIYNGSVYAKIEDISAYEIVTEIDEYDIAKVKIGQKVIIKTNGTGDERFDGEVYSIAPRATKYQNVNNTKITYKVKIKVLSKTTDLKIDMTAKISIIIDEKDDVLTVPYDAVQVDEEGNFYIEKAGENLTDDEKKIYVTKGIESDYYIEVMGDGVKEGLEVVVPSAGGLNEFMQMMIDQGAMGGM